MPNRIIAIGDIHGCAKALESLIQRVQPAPDDLIIPMGDYVDRGPDSRRVLDLLIDLTTRCHVVPLLGNHEIMMLQDLGSLRMWLECGGMATVDSYNGALETIPQHHLDFLRNCCRYVETEQFMFVHANYDAYLPLGEQPDNLLFWEHVVRRLPEPHQSGKKVIVGHTPQSDGEILDLGHLICIDTYCVGGGWLTGLEVGNGTTWQVDQDGQPRVRAASE
jgi:serine/threonine protein phosphatase 1